MPTATKQLNRYRVVSGFHAVKVSDEPLEFVQYGPGQEAGDIVETDEDLEVFNSNKGLKFVRLADDGREYGGLPARDELQNKSRAQLFKWIEEENEGYDEEYQLKVDPKATKKDLIEAIRRHVPGVSTYGEDK